MSVRNQLKLLVGGLAARRGGTAPPVAQSALREFMDRSPLVSAAIFLVTVVAILLISSAGIKTAHVNVLPGQISTVRLTAGDSFSYPSKLRTEAAHEQMLRRVPPVYHLATEPLQLALVIPSLAIAADPVAADPVEDVVRLEVVEQRVDREVAAVGGFVGVAVLVVGADQRAFVVWPWRATESGDLNHLAPL